MRIIKGRIARCSACNCYIEYTNDDLEMFASIGWITDKQKKELIK